VRSWSAGKTELWRAPAKGGDEARVTGSVISQFSAVSRGGIYFLSGWANPSVQCFQFDTGRVTTVARLDGRMAYGLSVSPDDHWLLYSKSERRGSNLSLVEDLR
jgi:hypothetical protein